MLRSYPKFYKKSNQIFNVIMSRLIYDYTKSVLERVSFDAKLFCKELEKALKTLLPYEIEQLTEWLLNFTSEKPELRQCLLSSNK